MGLKSELAGWTAALLLLNGLERSHAKMLLYRLQRKYTRLTQIENKRGATYVWKKLQGIFLKLIKIVFFFIHFFVICLKNPPNIFAPSSLAFS